jgi:AcrR family transcriptional regulator
MNAEKHIEKALGLFWNNGVTNTSYADLVRHTGLSRKALYANWADKKELVHDTVRLYREQVLGEIIAALEPPSFSKLEAFWDSMENSINNPEWIGCYLFRSATGELRDDPVIIAVFEKHILTLKSRIEAALTVAKADGDLPETFDADTAAWQAVSILSLMSAFGGQGGYGPNVAALLDAGRRSCGITA